MSKIRAIVFDYGGVISLPQAVSEFYPWAERETGLNEAAMKQAFLKYRADMDGGIVTAQEMYRRILADAKVTVSDAVLDELRKRDYDSWAHPNPATLAWAQNLQRAGYTIGILTNMPPDYMPWFDRCAKAFRLLADVEIVSGMVHKVKPHAPIYRDLIDRLNVPPDQILFFDDSPLNVEGARELGINSEVFVNVEQARKVLEHHEAE